MRLIITASVCDNSFRLSVLSVIPKNKSVWRPSFFHFEYQKQRCCFAFRTKCSNSHIKGRFSDWYDYKSKYHINSERQDIHLRWCFTSLNTTQSHQLYVCRHDITALGFIIHTIFVFIVISVEKKQQMHIHISEKQSGAHSIVIPARISNQTPFPTTTT